MVDICNVKCYGRGGQRWHNLSRSAEAHHLSTQLTCASGPKQAHSDLRQMQMHMKHNSRLIVSAYRIYLPVLPPALLRRSTCDLTPGFFGGSVVRASRGAGCWSSSRLRCNTFLVMRESSSSNANKCPEHTKDRKVWYLGFLKTSPVVVVSQAQVL